MTAQALLYDWLLPAEVFNEKDCPDDDVWPRSCMSRVALTLTLALALALALALTTCGRAPACGE